MDAIRLVVVVLPWVPATAIPFLNRINSESISALGITGILFLMAAFNSGLFLSIADEMTITSTFLILSAE